MIEGFPESECELLGLLLQTPETFPAYGGRLSEDAFTNDLTRTVWTGMKTLQKAGTQISIPALREKVSVKEGQYGIPNLTAFLMTCMQQATGELSLDDLVDLLSERATKTKLTEFAGELLKKVNDGRASTQEIALDAASYLSQLAASRSSSVGVSIHEAGKDFMDELIKAQQDGEPRGHDWGIRALDDLMGRIVMGDFGLIIGPSGHGKSALARGLAKHIAMREPTLTISAEETPQDIAAKDLIAATGVDSRAVEQGSINQQETEQLVYANQGQHGIQAFFEYTDDMRVSHIEMLVRAFKHRRGGCGAVFIDTIDDVDPEEKGSRSNAETVALVCRKLDKLSTKLQVPIIGLGQVKTIYNERPDISLRMSDSYGGQAVRNKASWVLLMHRPQKKIGDNLIPSASSDLEREKWQTRYDEWKDKAKFICAKRRRGPDGKTVTTGWSGPRTMFFDLDDNPNQEDLW